MMFYLIISSAMFGLLVGVAGESAKVRHTPFLVLAGLLWPITIGYWGYRHYWRK